MRAGELARIQQAAQAWLTQTCTITRPNTAEQTTDGWPSGGEVTIAANVTCRVEPASSRGGQERTAGAGVVANAEWNVMLPHDTPTVLPQDTITVAAVGVFDVVSSTSDRGVQTDVVARCTKRDAS